MIHANEAEQALKLAREAILGAKALREQRILDKAASGLAVAVLMETVQVLDLFLTQSIQQRSQTDFLVTVRLIAGDPDSRYPLSDGHSVLVFRWPTEEDPRPVQMLHTEQTPVDVRRRWMRIDNQDSEPTEFPNEVTYGRA